MSKQPTGNVTISGVSEFDYLGSENEDGKEEEAQDEKEEYEDDDPLRKSLEKDFVEAAEEDAAEGLSPVFANPDFEREEDEAIPEVPMFRANPVDTYERRNRASYVPSSPERRPFSNY